VLIRTATAPRCGCICQSTDPVATTCSLLPAALQLKALQSLGLPAQRRYSVLDADRELTRSNKSAGRPDPAATKAQLERLKELGLLGLQAGGEHANLPLTHLTCCRRLLRPRLCCHSCMRASFCRQSAHVAYCCCNQYIFLEMSWCV
jgi:hypothetical protein